MTHFYSQNGEDCLLWKLFDGPGFFVDVGAFDGVHLSNSLSFEEQGWDGICVEAHPGMFELCRQARRAVCIHAACVSDPDRGSVDFQIEKLGLLSGRRVDEADLRRRYDARGLPYEGTKTITVPAVTLTSLLEEVRRDVDFISIDVEGTELDVLEGLDLRTYRPRALVVEANSRAEGKRLQRYLRRFGYRLARKIRQNLFFTASPSDASKLRGSIECDIEANFHPLGERYTLPEARTRRRVFIPATSRFGPVRHLR